MCEQNWLLARLGWLAAFILMAGRPVAVSAAPGVAPTGPLAPQEQRKQFHLPPGFEIQLVVSDPDIGQPMNLNFDARGRLWITHSVEYPYPARGDVEPRVRLPGQADHEPRDRLTVVEGIGPDGRPKKITHFADGLNIPIGNTPLRDGNAALVYSIPNLYRATDTDGDGAADRRDVLFGKFGNIDTHGMVNGLTRWIDGWIYGCHGFANTSTIRDAAGNIVTMNSGNTYRFREDGSRFEQVTWGQVNPFGMTFDAWGNQFDSDCHSMPIYMLLRGAYYPSFGKPHDGLDFGPPMIDHGHGSTGICGPAYYAADHFPDSFRGSVFICNPVNCQVHHDRLTQTGSTFLVDTQPDFITCDDGWFRPVDLAVGPDGALYVADFYNCIIGHYEVPLDHPRRDRTHGRVWRVVYRGEDGQAAPPQPMPDLTKLPAEQIVGYLGDHNLVVRTLATNWLVDLAESKQTQTDQADGKSAANLRERIATAVRRAMRDGSLPELRAHGLWVLERLEPIGIADMQRFAGDDSPLVRTHAIRALAERAAWSGEASAIVLDALKDQNAIVRRVSADALGRHPNVNNIGPLFDLLASSPAEDTHLVHVARMALRDQLHDAEILRAVRKMSHDESQLRTLAELAISVKSSGAADLVLDYLERSGKDEPRLADYVAFAGQFLADESVDRLADVIRRRFAADAEFQVAQLQSIQTGLDRRGVTGTPAIVAWARELAGELLSTESPDALHWTSLPAADAPVPGNPWVPQVRPSDDGNSDALFWSSLPRGERLMGVLRSEPFDIPPELSFFTAGHNGSTNKPETPRNFIRLRHAETGAVLAEAKPPRHDTARRVTWDLARHKGRRGIIELVDAFDATGYAWLAVGRFSMDELNPDRFRPHAAARQLIERFRLAEFRPRLATIVRSTEASISQRRQAAETLLAFRPDARVSALLTAVGDEPGDQELNERIFSVCVESHEPSLAAALEEVMLRAPSESQRRLAAILAGDRRGGEALLQMAAEGKASPRLLLDQGIRNQLTALQVAEVDRRIEALTAKLPSVSDELLELLERRQRQFSLADSSPERGEKVFETSCAGCHQIAGKGSKVGPQLDGIGGRGLARLSEDVLDPNRNVDPAFYTTTLRLVSGKIVSGLIRRTEGETLVLADNQGKEFTVPKSDIDEQIRGTLSLMPNNFSESLREPDFHDLIAFLLASSSPASLPAPIDLNSSAPESGEQ